MQSTLRNTRRHFIHVLTVGGFTGAAQGTQPSSTWQPGQWQAALARAQAMREAAVQQGDQAYGAVVATAQGRTVAEAPSRVVALNDANAHAERQALAAAQSL